MVGLLHAGEGLAALHSTVILTMRPSGGSICRQGPEAWNTPHQGKPCTSAHLGSRHDIPLVNDANEVVTAYWAAANARDWGSFRDLLAEDVVYEGPQTRERVRGRAN